MTQEIELLKSASVEIKNLRRQNELMEARLDMFDNMMAVLHTPIAQKNRGMSPDLVWEIDKFIDSETTRKIPPEE